jgi:hypothetical protein
LRSGRRDVMKNCLLRVVLALMLGVMACGSHARAQGERADAPLTNAAIVKLARAGFKEKTIIAIIRTRPAQFDLSPDRLIDLKRNGVSENIILSMLAREEGAGTEFENLGDDPFFGDSSSGSHSQKSNGGNENSTDIFGSTNGSSGRTRSRGADGANEGDTMTTGSATVRILRPPVEPGATPKLEKTPTLNNQSIIELAEAGFTEGTIIRRIEQSPADFELTPQKIAELHRRHVSDKIIEAMKSAMSGTATP